MSTHTVDDLQLSVTEKGNIESIPMRSASSTSREKGYSSNTKITRSLVYRCQLRSAHTHERISSNKTSKGHHKRAQSPRVDHFF